MNELKDYRYRVAKIYINEKDCYEGIPMHKWIIKQAQQKNLLSVTVLRGIEGVGKNKLHTIKLLNLSIELPLIIEIFDQREKICDFTDNVLDGIIEEGIMTIEKIKAKVYKRVK